MRYAPEANVSFIHIPKNAGQSVRNALQAASPLSYAPLAADLGLSEAEAAQACERGFDHARLGRIHPAHLPLSTLRSHFPASWAALRGARSFALTRAPRPRFLSALMQRLREFEDAGAIRADDPLVRSEALRVCEHLDGDPARAHALDYIHFARQVDFVDLDEARVLDAVFPVEAMDSLSRWLRAEAGLEIAVSHDHSRRQPRRWARGLQPTARFAARRLMPRSLKRALHPLWVGSPVFANAARGYDATHLGEEVERFVAAHYAQDARLHAEALEQAKLWSAPRAELTRGAS